MPAALRPESALEVPVKRPRVETAKVMEAPKSATEKLMLMLELAARTEAAQEKENSTLQQATQAASFIDEIKLLKEENSRLRVSLTLIALRKWATEEYEANRFFERFKVNSLLADGTITALVSRLLVRPGPPPTLTEAEIQEVAQAFMIMEVDRRERQG